MKYILSQFLPQKGAGRREIEADSLSAAVLVAQGLVGKPRFIQHLTPKGSEVEGRLIGLVDLTEWTIWPTE